MNTLYVHRAAQALGIKHPVACLMDQVTVQSDSHELDEEITQLIAELPVRFETLQAQAEYQGFSELFANMGYPDQTPAGKRLIQGFIKNGFKRINNIVDAYNIVSARHGCGLGLHDASKVFAVADHLDIFTALDGDEITPLFKNKKMSVKPGDLVYGRSQDPRLLIAWLGKKDVDADGYKIDQDTQSLLLVVTGNARTSQEYNQAICDEVFQLIKNTSPDASIKMLSTTSLD